MMRRFLRWTLFALLMSGVVVPGSFAAGQDRARAKQDSVERRPGQKKKRAKAGRKAKSRNKAARRRTRKRASRRARVSPAYRQMVRRWHKRAPRKEIVAWRKQDPVPLVLRRTHKPMRVELIPSEDGAFTEEQCRLAEEALASKKDGTTHTVHPRLLELVYRASLKFRAPYVNVVSGYRQSRSTSRHNQGRAMDIVLPGVGNSRLARFFRQQGFVGVGVYPRSGFVHIDVREKSYYWRDFSLPGAKQRPRSILAAQRAKNDARARKRGELSVVDQVKSATPEEVPETAAKLVTIEPVMVTESQGIREQRDSAP